MKRPWGALASAATLLLGACGSSAAPGGAPAAVSGGVTSPRAEGADATQAVAAKACTVRVPVRRTGVTPTAIAARDLDGDGNVDLIVVDQGDTMTSHPSDVRVLLGSGGGQFRPGVSYLSGTAPVDVVVADFDGDGAPDLAVAQYL